MALVYSCCFWFSLRLGGILIGIFSVLQGILILAGSCWAYVNSEQITEDFTQWIKDFNLIFIRDYFENFSQDPEKYLSLSIGITCVYIITSVIFIYGAYICSNILMLPYIIMELLRLIIILTTVATGLLILKENTMDIGVLIGASIFGGFFLLGMFYLWVCAANLPILINEMNQEEQATTIAKLRQMLESNQNQIGRDSYRRYAGLDDQTNAARGTFFITNNNRNHRNINKIGNPIT